MSEEPELTDELKEGDAVTFNGFGRVWSARIVKIVRKRAKRPILPLNT